MRNALLVFAIVVAAILVGFLVYSQNSGEEAERYYVHSPTKGVLLKVDKKTGKTWVLGLGKMSEGGGVSGGAQ